MDDVLFHVKGAAERVAVRQVAGRIPVRQEALGWEDARAGAGTWTSTTQTPLTDIVAVTAGGNPGRDGLNQTRGRSFRDAAWSRAGPPTRQTVQTIYLFNRAAGNATLTTSFKSGAGSGGSPPGAAQLPGAWRALGGRTGKT